MDGSRNHSRYKQGGLAEDYHMFVTSLVPLRLVTTAGTVVWNNNTPNSPRYCRPLALAFQKETPELIRDECRPVAQQDICDGRGTQCRGTLTSQGPPPPNFNFLLGFRSLYFENMEKTFFWKILQKNVNVPAVGLPNYSRAPQFQFCPRISVTSFCKYDKTLYFL